MSFSGRQGGNKATRNPSKGLARRAEQQLNSAARSHAERFEEALAVDGVPVAIWNKSPGSVTCTCRKRSRNLIRVYEGDDGSVTDYAEELPSTHFADGLVTDDELTSILEDRLIPEPTTKQRILGETQDSITSASTFAERDVILSDDVFAEADALLNAVAVTCPICYNSGNVDAWQLFGGKRILLDLSDMYPVNITGGQIVEPDEGIESVPIIELSQRGEEISWQVQLPLTWKILARIRVYENEEIVDPSSYTLTFKLDGDDVEQNLDAPTLKALRGNPALSGEATVFLRPVKGYRLYFTHVDLVFLLTPPVRAQMPDMEIPYEEEYLDWNLNISVELSAKATVKEGSYLVDFRYNRVWKVDSYNRRATVTDTVFGITANCRALQPFEKMLTTLNIFDAKRR